MAEGVWEKRVGQNVCLEGNCGKGVGNCGKGVGNCGVGVGNCGRGVGNCGECVGNCERVVGNCVKGEGKREEENRRAKGEEKINWDNKWVLRKYAKEGEKVKGK